MQTLRSRTALALFALTVSGAAWAVEAPSSLQGAWVEASLDCSSQFNKAEGRFTLKKLDDFNVGAFIIEGNKIKGQSSQCTIDRAKQNGSQIHLLLACDNSVMASTQELHLEMLPDGSVKRYFTDFTDFTQSYKQCR
jgi:hypothetical protein